MIKYLFLTIKETFKLLGKILKYILIALSWYFKETKQVLKEYPKKVKSKLKGREEIL